MPRPRKPTTDERIQAIAMNLELLTSMQLTTERHLQELEKSVTRNFRACLQSIKSLENIARAHAAHLDDHDERIKHLERRK